MYGGFNNNGNAQALQGWHLNHHQYFQQHQQNQRFTKGFNGHYPLRRGNSHGIDGDNTHGYGSTTPVWNNANGYSNGYGGGLNGRNGNKSNGFQMLGQHASTRNVYSSSFSHHEGDAESQLRATTHKTLGSHVPGGTLLENQVDFQDLAQAGNVKFLQSANGRIDVISASINSSGNVHGNVIGGGHGAATQGNGPTTTQFTSNGNGANGTHGGLGSGTSITHGGFNCAFDHPKSEIRCPNLSQAQKDQCKIDLTDEFLMYKFKTIWCPIGVKHDWQSCVYAHNYQDARRNPKIGYGPKTCPMWRPREIFSSYDSGCPNGVRCPNAHGPKEQLYHPVHWKTRCCQNFNWGKERKNHKLCPRGRLCAFWHTNQDRKAYTEHCGFDYSQVLGDEQIRHLQSDFTIPTIPTNDIGVSKLSISTATPESHSVSGVSISSTQNVAPTDSEASSVEIAIIEEQSVGKEEEYKCNSMNLPTVNGFIHFGYHPSTPETRLNAHVAKPLRRLVRNNSFC